MTTLITPLPTPPTRQDSANFNDRADDFLGSLPLFQQEANALAVDVQASADAIEIARQAVASVANVTKWVSGTTYTQGTAVWSPINGVTYRKMTTSVGGTTDPSLDTTNYKSITDAAGITYTPAGTGAVPTDAQSKLRESVSVKDFGAKGDGSVNDMPAVLIAKAYGSNIHFPQSNNTTTTYYLGAFTAGQLDGISISTDTDVTLSFAENAPYSLYKNIKFNSDVRVYFRDIQDYYVFPKTPSTVKKDYLQQVVTASTRAQFALDCTSVALVKPLAVNWPTGDTFSVAASTSASDSLTITDTASGYFRGAFVDLGPYETVSAHFTSGVAPGAIGVILRGLAGYSIIYSNGSDNYYTAYKPIGAGVVGNTANLSWSVLGQGVYDSYKAENSVWSVTRVSKDKAIVKLNGKAITALYATGCGDIHSVGFVCYNGSSFSVSGLTVERRTDAVVGGQMLSEIRVFGDSTAETFPGSWDKYIVPMLDGSFGIKVNTVANYAVVGETLDQQYSRMQANGLGSAYYIVVCAGTNNIQALQSLSTFKTTVTNILTYITGQGRKPVIVIPWMWYTQAQASGKGQASANYAAGAPYRMALERLAFQYGAVVVKTPEELPNPDPSYLSSSAPLLRDNIHQDTLAYQLYARAICQAIMDDYVALPGSVEQILPGISFMNGAADVDVRLCIDKSGLAYLGGTMTVSTITTNTQILQLPRFAFPTRSTNIKATALSSGAAAILGEAYLNVNAATGVVTINNAPASTAILILDMVAFKTAYAP